MLTFMRRYERRAYALLGNVTGFLLLWHGMQKLFGFPGEVPPGTPAVIRWTVGPIELGRGTLGILGLFTRPAAFLASGRA